nr:MAG TPA: hypothetical protein [Bacteriophage sp.]
MRLYVSILKHTNICENFIRLRLPINSLRYQVS